MDLNKITKQITINIVLGGVFIQNKHFNFHYTPVKDAVDCANYWGGLQCNYDVDSREYKQLEYELCRIAWNVLNLVKNRNVNNFQE